MNKNCKYCGQNIKSKAKFNEEACEECENLEFRRVLGIWYGIQEGRKSLHNKIR